MSCETHRNASAIELGYPESGRLIPVCRACRADRYHYLEGWKERERIRFENGTYEKIPDGLLGCMLRGCKFGCGWYSQNPAVADHYLHVSQKDRTQVAYTPNADKGARDIQVSVKLGRYLARYFPELSPERIAAIATQYESGQKAPELKFATDPDDIERVYADGPRSCMQGQRSVRVYGAGDLAIAYLEPREGEITARALCWPERKHYGRVYGDAERLTRALTDEGYSTSGSFRGARLLAEPYDSNRSERYVLPYLDQGYGVKVSECGGYLVLGSGNGFECGNTQDGFIDLPDENRAHCENCNSSMDLDESHTVDGREWCDTCVERNASYCEGCEQYREGLLVTVLGGDGLCADCLECSDAVSCDECGEWTLEPESREFAPTVDDEERERAGELCDGCLPQHTALRRCAVGWHWTSAPVARDSRECADCCAARLQLPLPLASATAASAP